MLGIVRLTTRVWLRRFREIVVFAVVAGSRRRRSTRYVAPVVEQPRHIKHDQARDTERYNNGGSTTTESRSIAHVVNGSRWTVATSNGRRWWWRRWRRRRRQYGHLLRGLAVSRRDVTTVGFTRLNRSTSSVIRHVTRRYVAVTGTTRWQHRRQWTPTVNIRAATDFDVRVIGEVDGTSVPLRRKWNFRWAAPTSARSAAPIVVFGGGSASCLVVWRFRA